MALGKFNKRKKSGGSESTGLTDHNYITLGAVWERTGKNGEYNTLDFDVSEYDSESKERSTVGRIVLIDYRDPKNPKHYKLKQLRFREVESDNPNAPLFNVSVDLANEYQAEFVSTDDSDDEDLDKAEG